MFSIVCLMVVTALCRVMSSDGLVLAVPESPF